MRKPLLFISVLTASFVTMNAIAANKLSTSNEFNAPIQASVVVTKPTTPSLRAGVVGGTSAPTRKKVYLMNISLDHDQMKQLLVPTPAKAAANRFDSTLPSRAILGMNNVPALDQGWHGSCVTFASTAALDAVLHQGDYISQLCLLEMGDYLEKRSYLPSGWDGSYGPAVLERIMDFGIVSKAKQLSQSCGGITAYPTTSESHGSPMSIDDYANLSEDLTDKVYWTSLLTPDERFANDAVAEKVTEQTLLQIKHILSSPRAKYTTRLTFGVILPYTHCSSGACAQFHKQNDTWALTDEILQDHNPAFAGHEMVITGYDDEAVATDATGRKHKGLLYVRNSWGDTVGDNGDYYITYDYFNQFILEVQKISTHN